MSTARAPSLSVRRLDAPDAPAYRALMLHAYEHAADAFTSTPQERAAQPEAWWVRRIADPGGEGVAFGAFEGSELVGTVALEFATKAKTRHKVQLVGMFVIDRCRGQGLGKALVEAAIGHARSRPGARVITLTVTKGNAPAECLYASCGFQTFGVEPMAILTPGGLRAKLHMYLGLDVVVEPVVPADADAVRALMARAIHPILAHDEAQLRDTLENVNANLDLWLAQPERCVHLKASIGNALAGVILVKDHWNLCSLFVEPAQQHRGIGRVLVEAAADACRGRSPKGALLLNAAANAVGFYERLGFNRRVSAQTLPAGVLPLQRGL